MAQWDKNLPPVWLSQILSCNFSKSSSDTSGWMQSRYSPKKERLYSFWSSNTQKWGAFLRTLFASDLSSGKMSYFRNSIMGSIKLGHTLTCWTWATFSLISVGLHKSSIRITRGKLCTEEVANVTRESTYVFPLLGTCSRLNNSNFDCKCLTWLKYPCILLSLTSNSPFTWPTTSLESKNIFTAFPPIFWTMDIPSNKTSYSASLFVAEKPSLSDFSIVICSGETKTSPTTEPLWFAAPSTYTFQNEGSCREIVPTDFPSMFYVAATSSNRGSANSATRSTNTWPLTEVRCMYLISKAPKTVPHLAILPI